MGRLVHRAAPGISYFVTTKTWQNRALFRVTEIAEIVIQTMLHYRQKGEYLLHEFVVMPDHLHVLITPSPNNSLEKAMQLIKGGSSYRVRQQRGQKIEVWHAGFHDWTIRDAVDWNSKAQYIRLNPVKAGLAERQQDWPYSSGSSKLALDPMPAKYLAVASGAKAQFLPSEMSDLKVRPPKEKSSETAQLGLKPQPTDERNNDCSSGQATADRLDPIAQRLKPEAQDSKCGPAGPTPNTFSRAAKG
jgi:putative transposase